mgnify:CR=1 FL=1|tara:strand:+ start:516 stop:1067 length:552 start_codon:yes stop_codon:yes gene_type:complete
MNQNQKNIWKEYLENKHAVSNSNSLLRIEFSGDFFNDYPVYHITFNDYAGGKVFFWHIIAIEDYWYEDHTGDFFAVKKEGEFIPNIILNNKFIIYKRYFKKIKSLMTLIKYPFIGYEKNYAAFIILCFRKSNHHMPEEMICLILSFLRRADIKIDFQKSSVSKNKNYLESFMDYFPILRSLFS